MEQFIERFERNLRKYLEPLEAGKVYYDFSLDLQTMHVVIFPENLQGVLSVDVYSEDEHGERLLDIGNRFFRERTKEDAENIFRKFMTAAETDFQIREWKMWRDEEKWKIEKGHLLIKRR